MHKLVKIIMLRNNTIIIIKIYNNLKNQLYH